MSLTLYIDSNYLSPYALSAFVALREKGLAFTTIPVDLQAGAHRTGAMSALSATLRVPTLSDGEFHLSESSAIAEYLEDAYPGPRLYPGDPKHRAKAREIQAWIRSDLLPLRMERSTEVVFREVTPPPLSEAAQAAADKLLRGAERLLPPGAAHLFGEWCVADTDLALMLQRLLRAGDKVPERLADYANAQWQRAAVQEWVALGRKSRGDQ
jgi:glutathione S-transferase